MPRADVSSSTSGERDAVAVPNEQAPVVSCPDSDDVRVAYPVAVELRLEASRGVFERFNILLLSNSIILLGVVSALAATRPLFDVSAYLSMFGIVVCWVWLKRIRGARQRITDYGDAIEALERCLPGSRPSPKRESPAGGMMRRGGRGGGRRRESRKSARRS
jgi:hypothetical protein